MLISRSFFGAGLRVKFRCSRRREFENRVYPDRPGADLIGRCIRMILSYYTNECKVSAFYSTHRSISPTLVSDDAFHQERGALFEGLLFVW